jgi:hypothetical protein
MIRRTLGRRDLLGLVAAIHRRDPEAGAEAARALAADGLDALLDAPASVEAVRGSVDGPGAVALPLLWYVPIRGTLLRSGEPHVALADYAASLCVTFADARALRLGAPGSAGIADWWRGIQALPAGSVARGERAADAAGLALWWGGCFPVWAEHGGRGGVEAYTTFACAAYAAAADTLRQRQPNTAPLLAYLAVRAKVVRDAIADTARDYLALGAHTEAGRLERYFDRLNLAN